MLKLKQHTNGIWYVKGTVTVWRNGQPHTVPVDKTTKTRDRHEADAIRRQIEGTVAEQNITGREPALSFNAAADRYVNNDGDDTYLKHPRRIFGRLRIDEITQEMLDDEGVKLYSNSATRRRQFHTPIIAVLNANGVNKKFKRPKDSPSRTYFLRPDQFEQFLSRVCVSRYPNPWTPALVTFLFGQGTRIAETLRIDGKHDISLADRYAILRKTKNGEQRMVTLCPRVVSALSQIPNIGEPGPLFLRYDGRPYNPKLLVDDDTKKGGIKFTWWARAIGEIGLDPQLYTIHTSRHSWATWFYSQTLDLVRLRAEGGWKSMEWERYVKLAIPTMGQDAKKLGFNFSRDAFAVIEGGQNEAGTDPSEMPKKFMDFSRAGR